MAPITIIGSGLAGYTVARELRKLDKDIPLRIISRDHGGFYSKPMLSNALAGNKSAEQLLMKSAAQMAAELNAEILSNTGINAIDRQAHQLHGSAGVLAYSKLVLALGADPFTPELAGDAADEVLSVNDLDDYRRFRAALADKHNITILGAGLIGCEFANDLLGQNLQIQLVDLAESPLSRLLPPAAGAYLQQQLEKQGVTFHLGSATQHVQRHGNGYRLTLHNGVQFDTDLVLSAIGLRPRVTLAQQAGLAVERGISVNRQLQTSDADIYALGDCAEVTGYLLPFVMPIMQAARALAANLAGNTTDVRYPAMPVAVKTPACPTTICPPPAGSIGQWQIEIQENGLKALCVDDTGKPLGFALMGSANAEKQLLATQMPAWLV